MAENTEHVLRNRRGNYKIIVIGLNPSSRKTRKRIYINSSVDKLYSWTDTLNLPIYSFTNLFWRTDNNFSFMNIDKDVIDMIKSYDKVIVLGNIVSRHFYKLNIAHFKLPHPSPKNRKLNNREYELNILDSCKKYVV